MKKFRYFILVIAGVAVMLGGCKDKEKYDEYAQSYGYENGDAFIEANGEDGEEKLKESILLDTAMTWVADHAKFVEAETEK